MSRSLILALFLLFLRAELRAAESETLPTNVDEKPPTAQATIFWNESDDKDGPSIPWEQYLMMKYDPALDQSLIDTQARVLRLKKPVVKQNPHAPSLTLQDGKVHLKVFIEDTSKETRPPAVYQATTSLNQANFSIMYDNFSAVITEIVCVWDPIQNRLRLYDGLHRTPVLFECNTIRLNLLLATYQIEGSYLHVTFPCYS